MDENGVQKNEILQIKTSYSKEPNGEPVLDVSKRYSDSGFIPDWDFMENFIKSLKYKLPETKRNTYVDISSQNWVSFTLEELGIDIYKAKAHTKLIWIFLKSKTK